MVALLGAVTAFARSRLLDLSLFMSDPATYLQAPFYTGIVSQVGMVGWAASASVSLFAAAILARANRREPALFLAAFGALTALMLVDDLFLLHEIFLPYYVGVPQKVVLVSYALLAVLGLVTFARTIARTAAAPLAAALACFAGSMAIDSMQLTSEWRLLWEDGFKLFGIVFWTLYLSHTSAVAVIDLCRSREPARRSRAA